jgi:hypothetical protein
MTLANCEIKVLEICRTYYCIGEPHSMRNRILLE